MPKAPPKPDDIARALRLLANAPAGKTEATMVVVHGFAPRLLAELIKAKLVTTHRERAGRDKQIAVVRLRITHIGRARLSLN